MSQADRAAEERQKKEDVKKALAQAAPPESARKPAARERGLLWIGVLGGLFLLLGGFWLLVRDGVLELPGWSDNFAHRVPLAAAIVVGLLLAARLAEIYGISRVESPVSRYNLVRVARLVAAALILGGAGAALFGNFYTGLVSLGVVSISSFPSTPAASRRSCCARS